MAGSQLTATLLNAAAHLLHGRLQRLVRVHDLFDRAVDPPPLLREADTRLVAHQKAKAELLFERAEILRQRALRHTHGLRRLRDRAALHCF